MGTKVPSRKELGEMVLEGMSGGGLMGHGSDAEDEEEDFAPLAGSDDFEVADLGPAPAAPTAAAPPPPSAAAAAPATAPAAEEEELPPPRVSTTDAVDMSKMGPPPPPPPPPPPGGAAPPPPPPPPPAAVAAPPPPDTFEIEEGDEDEFKGWELDTGEQAPDIGP
jgi:hypothetical protein